MHPARLAYLAGQNAPKRAVVSTAREGGGCWKLTLACGHTGQCAPHFDCSKTREWACGECGVEFVKTSPRWADEFRTNDDRTDGQTNGSPS